MKGTTEAGAAAPAYRAPPEGMADHAPPIAVIKRHIAAHFGVPVTDLCSARRDRASTRPRHVAIYLARRLTPASCPAIGRAFGRRDHSSVMYAVKQTEERMAHQPAFAAEVERLSLEISDAEAAAVEARLEQIRTEGLPAIRDDLVETREGLAAALARVDRQIALIEHAIAREWQR